MTKFLCCGAVKTAAYIQTANITPKIYFGCKPILERKAKILYFQGFSAFNGCKPILTITEEGRRRKSFIQGLNIYAGHGHKRCQVLTLA